MSSDGKGVYLDLSELKSTLNSENAFEAVKTSRIKKKPTSTVSTAAAEKKEEERVVAKEQELDLEKVKILAQQFIEAAKKAVVHTAPKKDEPEVSELKFEVGQGFYLYPLLGTVDHPLVAGTQFAISVRVGSRAWLTCLDQLRTYGWNQEAIDKFLAASAEVVKNDLLHDVYKEVNGVKVNTIEAFCRRWPDPDKQRDKIRKKTEELFDAIRETSPTRDALAPQNKDLANQGKEAPKVPPKPVNLVFKDADGVSHEFKDITRHFVVPKKVVTSIDAGGNVEYGWECFPAEGKPWIPIEYRKKLEDILGITPIYYIDPIEWKKYMLTLMSAENVIANKSIPEGSTMDAKLVQLDASGRWSIVSKGRIAGSQSNENVVYRVFRNSTTINERNCPELDSELSLREWCELFENINEFYPLLYVMLNVEAPSRSAQFSDPAVYDSFLWRASSNGVSHKRLTADAPLKLFRQLLIEQYPGEVKEGLGYERCMRNFINAVWVKIVEGGINPEFKDSDPKHIPPKYKKVLEQIYTLGGKERKCYDPRKPVSVTNNKLGIPALKVLSRQQIENMSFAEKKRLASTSALSQLIVPKK